MRFRGMGAVVVDVVDVELVDGARVWVDLDVSVEDRVVRGVVLLGAVTVLEDVCDGGRRVVAPVSVVADDLVRAWPAPAGRLVVDDEGTPDDVVGRDSVGAGPEAEVGLGAGRLRVVIGGRDVVVAAVDEPVAALLLCTGCRTEADRPRPNSPEIGLLLPVVVPLLPSPLLTATEAARVRGPDETEDVLGGGIMPLTGNLLGETFRGLSWLGSDFFFSPGSVVVGLRRDRDRASDDIAGNLCQIGDVLVCC
jgi:hypothetical protein